MMKSKNKCFQKPKICTSIVGRTEQEILESAKMLGAQPIEMVEWRVDFFNEIEDLEKTSKIICFLKEKLSSKELIFTLRTTKEGGEKIPESVSYRKTLESVICQGKTDYVDIEIYWDSEDQKEMRESLLSLAKEKRMKTIGSYHDFEKTPSIQEIEFRLRYMQELGVTIGKMATMPNSEKDVELLLEATSIVKLSEPHFPIITMSMGALGKSSRIYGGLYGSLVTFGYGETASAPGQVPIKELRKTIDNLYSGKKHIVLIGFMGVGKTTIANELAKLSECKVIDTDQLITIMEGRSIEEIFSTEGEEYFRKLETKSIDRVGGLAPSIVSCGGGMVLRDINIKKLQAIGTVVLLTAKPKTILSRVKDSDTRPILNGNMNKEYIRKLMEERKPYYEKAAELTISTEQKSVSAIAEEILINIKK